MSYAGAIGVELKETRLEQVLFIADNCFGVNLFSAGLLCVVSVLTFNSRPTLLKPMHLNIKVFRPIYQWGGAVRLWLFSSTMDRAVLVRALPENIVLRSWARLAVALFTQV